MRLRDRACGRLRMHPAARRCSRAHADLRPLIEQVMLWAL